MTHPYSRCFHSFGSLTLLLAVVGFSVESNAAEEPVFRAGAAASNITPAIGLPIIGGFHPAPSQHVHDELQARTMVLDDGRTRVAIVICDLLGIGRDVCEAAVTRIAAECGVPASNVLIAGTHTHSASSTLGEDRISWQRPALDEYQQFVVSRIVDGVRRSVNQLEPAEIAWASVDEPRHVFNRRWYLKPGTMPTNPFGRNDDQVKMNPGRGNPNLVKPAGPVDPQIWTVCVRSRESKRPIALLSNYSLHYVGGVGPGHISADYFGMFADRVVQLLDAERQDPPMVAMMSNGTSGDINNVNVAGPGEKHAPYEKMRIVAADTARVAVASLEKAEWRTSATLGAARRNPLVGSREITTEMLDAARRLLSEPADPAKPATLDRIYAERVTRLANWPKQVPVPLQVLQIGDLAIGTMPCEVFAEIGLELKQKSPSPAYFTIELAHGYYGYLPTPEQHRLGGYETWPGTNRLEPQASRQLTDELLKMLEETRGAANLKSAAPQSK